MARALTNPIVPRASRPPTTSMISLEWELLLAAEGLPQQCLYFFPLAQGHVSFRPTLGVFIRTLALIDRWAIRVKLIGPPLLGQLERHPAITGCPFRETATRLLSRRALPGQRIGTHLEVDDERPV